MNALAIHRPTPPDRVLLVSKAPAATLEILTACDDAAFEVEVAADSAAVAELLAKQPFEVCLADRDCASADHAALEQAIAAHAGAVQLVRFACDTEERDEVERLSPGATAQRICRAVELAARQAHLHAENRSLKRQLQSRVLHEIIGQSEPATQLRDAIRAVAEQDDCVLIQGEAGTGSQQVALVIHGASRRAMRPFLAIDCRVHSAESLDAELFGDAADIGELGGPNDGRVASCFGGTLLLKNVETIAVSMQRKLAAVLAKRAYVCGVTGKTRALDVRIVASTHADLAVEAQAGRFNASLYEGLTIHVVALPALRDRRQDIGLIAEQILNRLSLVEGKPVKRLGVEALKMLKCYEWPGNQRELENVVERACALDEGRLLTAEMLSPWIARSADELENEPATLSLREMERKLIETTFTRCQGNREQTAKLLKIGIRTLSGKLREYGYPPRGGPGSNRKLASSKAA